jgi:hypothetical protein
MRSIRARTVAVVVALVALGAVSPRVAHASGRGDAARDIARGLAGKGYESFEAGNYARAIDFFEQAEKRYHAPPHLLYIARAQVKLGKLLEAEHTYRRVLNETLSADAPAPFKDAQTSARSELVETQVLVPTLVIDLEGDVPKGTRVSVDGTSIDEASWGKPLRQNPGTHLVTAEPPGKPAIGRTVVLKLGGGADKHVTVRLPRTSGSLVPALVCYGVGAVGLGVGVTTAVLGANASKSGSLRGAAITGFVIGGAGVAAGVVLTILRPRFGAAPEAARIGPLRDVRFGLGAASAEITGRF